MSALRVAWMTVTAVLLLATAATADPLYLVTVEAKDGGYTITKSVPVDGRLPQLVEGGRYVLTSQGAEVGAGYFSMPSALVAEGFPKDGGVTGTQLPPPAKFVVITPAPVEADAIELVDPQGKTLAKAPVGIQPIRAPIEKAQSPSDVLIGSIVLLAGAVLVVYVVVHLWKRARK